ncbi:MAG: hypothetical protein UY21_C0004G0016 [Microgenomates group bacterium GW2011_GWA1_48_10]|nr:MAG: hypothetical protein UY21_C0004G0016 [Microgenomates group bacterium GW2011_GWA1_48_10]
MTQAVKLTLRFFLLVVLSFFIILLFKQSSPIKPVYGSTTNLIWATSSASLSVPRAALGAVNASNGKIYVVGGSDLFNGNYRFFNTVEEINPNDDSIIPRAPLSVARNQVSLAATSDGKIYAIGGYNTNWSGGGSLSVVEVFNSNDAANSVWTRDDDMLTARGMAGTATLNGKIYIIGGWNGTALNIVEEFNPSAPSGQRWRRLRDMPTARWNLAAAAGSDGKVYAIGGQLPSFGYTNVVEVYDPITDSWATAPTMPTVRGYLSAVKAADGRIYVVGGWNNYPHLRTVESFDTNLNSWQSETDMPTARDGIGLAATTDGQIYAIGGEIVGPPSYTVTGIIEKTKVFMLPDVSLLAPVNKGISLSTLHGYNDPPWTPTNTNPCKIPSKTDHCRNQQFGLDLAPDASWDFNIIAPAPGTPSSPVSGSGGNCLNFKLDDGTNLNICHFKKVTAPANVHVERGKILGKSSQKGWVHLSLDSRPALCSVGWKLQPKQSAQYYCPLQFISPYTFEGRSLNWDGSPNQLFTNIFPLVSSNVSLP